MKKSFLQKFISQKIILTMFVGLLLGGCSLDTRKPFYLGDIVKKKTFIEYFEEGEYYGDNKEYLYTIKDEVSYLGGYKFNNNAVDMVGTFGEFDYEGYGTVLTATVDTTTGNITITVVDAPAGWSFTHCSVSFKYLFDTEEVIVTSGDEAGTKFSKKGDIFWGYDGGIYQYIQIGADTVGVATTNSNTVYGGFNHQINSTTYINGKIVLSGNLYVRGDMIVNGDFISSGFIYLYNDVYVIGKFSGMNAIDNGGNIYTGNTTYVKEYIADNLDTIVGSASFTDVTLEYVYE